MKPIMRILVLMAGSVALLGTAGCASSDQLESLRAEVRSAQTTADSAMARANAAYDLASQANQAAADADSKAQAAMTEAQAAKKAAATADAKAERIYTQSLRK